MKEGTDQTAGKLSKETSMVFNALSYASQIASRFMLYEVLDFDLKKEAYFCERFALYNVLGRKEEVKRVMDLPESGIIKKFLFLANGWRE